LQEVDDSPGPTIKLNMFTGNFVLGRIDVENRDYHQLSRFEIAGAKTISRHLSAGFLSRPRLSIYSADSQK
jgi:hypothetical protein